MPQTLRGTAQESQGSAQGCFLNVQSNHALAANLFRPKSKALPRLDLSPTCTCPTLKPFPGFPECSAPSCCLNTQEASPAKLPSLASE